MVTPATSAGTARAAASSCARPTGSVRASAPSTIRTANSSPPEPTEQLTVVAAVGQALAEQPEQVVAGVVAERLVHRAEPVHAEQHQGHRTGEVSPPQLGVAPGDQCRAGSQAGERVMDRVEGTARGEVLQAPMRADIVQGRGDRIGEGGKGHGVGARQR